MMHSPILIDLSESVPPRRWLQLGNQLAKAKEAHGRSRVEGDVSVNEELVGRCVAVRHVQIAGAIVGELKRWERHLLP
eukprot:scaffold51492_cov32-Tisochrysis_lutea.AAC.2